SLSNTSRPPRSPVFPYTTLFRSPQRASQRIEAETVGVYFRRPTPRSFRIGDAMNYKAWVAKAAKQPMVLETVDLGPLGAEDVEVDRKSTRLNSSHQIISYAVFCL